MPLPSSIVGARVGPVEREIDARWLMAYAAGLGDDLPCYLDTTRPEGIVGHPLFPVCYEWDLILALGRQSSPGALSDAERMRGVHASHDVLLHRPLRAGERIVVWGEIAGVERRRPGAYQVTRLVTSDTLGQPVCETWYGSIFRGVDVEGPDRPVTGAPEPLPSPETGETLDEMEIPISALAAHVYTECSRIWNPIHTDAAVARDAGLPAIILHGTANLALAVSAVLRHETGEGAPDPRRVRRVSGRFGAMVEMPQTALVRVLGLESTPDGVLLDFELRTERGEPAVRDGRLLLASEGELGVDVLPTDPRLGVA